MADETADRMCQDVVHTWRERQTALVGLQAVLDAWPVLADPPTHGDGTVVALWHATLHPAACVVDFTFMNMQARVALSTLAYHHTREDMNARVVCLLRELVVAIRPDAARIFASAMLDHATLHATPRRPAPAAWHAALRDMRQHAWDAYYAAWTLFETWHDMRAGMPGGALHFEVFRGLYLAPNIFSYNAIGILDFAAGRGRAAWLATLYPGSAATAETAVVDTFGRRYDPIGVCALAFGAANLKRPRHRVPAEVFAVIVTQFARL
jgi:hypothetical protein